jgi:hypothetical protein
MTLLPALAAAELSTAAQRRLVRAFHEPAPSRTVRLVRRRGALKPYLAEALAAAVLAVLPPECAPGPRTAPDARAVRDTRAARRPRTAR